MSGIIEINSQLLSERIANKLLSDYEIGSFDGWSSYFSRAEKDDVITNIRLLIENEIANAPSSIIKG